MLKRELIRIAILGGIGTVLMFIIMFSGHNGVRWWALVMPFYVIGMVYAGKILWKALCGVGKAYFSGQVMSLVFNPLWGTILCLLLLFLGLAVILSFGWLIGIGRCIYCLVKDFQVDGKVGINHHINIPSNSHRTRNSQRKSSSRHGRHSSYEDKDDEW